MRLLVVEDDPMIGESMQRGLKKTGFAVDWVRDGKSAEHALGNGVYDMMILDLGLPRKGGLELLSQLRERGNDLPVLIVTARDTVDDKVAGLNSGADDYLVRPFDFNELNARVNAIMRRHSVLGQPGNDLRCANIGSHCAPGNFARASGHAFGQGIRFAACVNGGTGSCPVPSPIGRSTIRLGRRSWQQCGGSPHP
jgi:DNA-binding response OmpR family regulator